MPIDTSSTTSISSLLFTSEGSEVLLFYDFWCDQTMEWWCNKEIINKKERKKKHDDYSKQKSYLCGSIF